VQIFGPIGMSMRSNHVRDRVRAILEKQLAAVDSLNRAAVVVQRTRETTDGASEADRADAARHARTSALKMILAAGRGRSAPIRFADILVATASQGVAPTEDAAAVAEAAYDVLGSGTHRVQPPASRGRSLLRSAAQRGLGPLARLEARLFLGLSSLPHPALVHATCEGIGSVATGGWIWVIGTLGAYLLRVEGSDRALKLVAPTIAAVAFISERPAKAFFSPRRPFNHLVTIMLLGGKPRGRSFPGGHAATSFAAAWSLGSVWPRRGPVFLGLAALVSLSRVYLGAHDPGEILAGTALGVALAELLRRPLDRLLSEVELPHLRPDAEAQNEHARAGPRSTP
jgi:undecaprenyl-diphosphatase